MKEHEDVEAYMVKLYGKLKLKMFREKYLNFITPPVF